MRDAGCYNYLLCTKVTPWTQFTWLFSNKFQITFILAFLKLQFFLILSPMSPLCNLNCQLLFVDMLISAHAYLLITGGHSNISTYDIFLVYGIVTLQWDLNIQKIFAGHSSSQIRSYIYNGVHSQLLWKMSHFWGYFGWHTSFYFRFI